MCQTRRGFLVLADEMGKFLEFAAQHPNQGDVQVLQEMAESAVRSGNTPILFVTVLHQAFDEYAHRLGPVQRTEWQKVQGRFTDIAFGDTGEESLRLIAEALQREPDDTRNAAIAVQSRDFASTASVAGILPRTLTVPAFAQIIDHAYPLHPLTLLLLPAVFRRFGQSERSLFGFLSGDEPLGFGEFLNSRAGGESAGGKPLPYNLSRLFDYVVSTFAGALFSQGATARLWSETQEAVFRCEGRSELDLRLVKTIGLLHILAEQTRISPTREVLRFAFAGGDVTAAEVDLAIDGLEMSTLITYRAFRKAYRPYAGSEIDVEERVREARASRAGLGKTNRGKHNISPNFRLGFTCFVFCNRDKRVQ